MKVLCLCLIGLMVATTANANMKIGLQKGKSVRWRRL